MQAIVNQKLHKGEPMTIWPFLFGLFFLIFWWRMFRDKNKKRLYNHPADALICIIGLIFTSLLGLILSTLIGYFLPIQFTKLETSKLSRLSDCKATSICPFLVTVKDVYYYKLDKGRPVGVEMVGGDVAVFEEDRSDGEFMVYTYQFTEPLSQWIALERHKQKKYYVFCIPEGSNFVFE